MTQKINTTHTGRNAENAAAEYLRLNGYVVMSQNWRTRWCEIDIVAIQANIVYFVEVKYRKSASWGDGLDAITSKKLQQMTFAAEMWVQQEKWRGDYALAVISADGTPPVVSEFIVI